MPSPASDFDSALQQLNAAQKEAVETLFGPVLVVAGPGTGKTQVLAMRIAQILTETDTKPESILALTFTESGAIAMRRRLLSIIGPTAHSVTIATFHGFCQGLISEFPEKFLFARRLSAIEDIAKIKIFEAILEKLNLKFLRPFKNPTYFLKDILSSIAALKKEGITPEELQQAAEHERAEFEAIPEQEKLNPKTGKPKLKYGDIETRLKKYAEFAQVFAAYQAELQAQGWYDFEDMIMFVLEKLKTDEDLLWTLRERFLFLLADEFQDSNGAQMELLTLFAGEDDAPNIFAVGDDDQSVYRFQGASLENILTFHERFPSAKVITLTENYRSTQAILDLAGASIAHNTERLVGKLPEIQKELMAVRGGNGEKPKVYVFNQEEQERHFLIEQIRALKAEGISFAEIAILVRKNSAGFELLDLLNKEGIPASFSGRGNALSDQVVHQLLTLLELAVNPEDDARFFECLHYRFFQIPIESIWEVWEQSRGEEKGSFGKLWRRYFREKAAVFEPQIPMPIFLFGERLERWQYDLNNLTLVETFQKVATESGLLDLLTGSTALTSLPSVQNFEHLNALNALFADLKQYVVSAGTPTLSGFLERLALRQEYALSLAERDLFTAENEVQIMTAHKAKGLEFTAVFVPQLMSGCWGDQRTRSKIPLPENLLRFQLEADPNEEERRLFYVACTRAKKHLFLSRSEYDASGREGAESRFLSELPADLIEVKSEDGDSAATAFGVIKQQLSFAAERSKVFPEAFLRRVLSPENFTLSFSAFENFRENPQQFLWKNVLAIPEAPHPSAALGTALHRALEEFFRLLPEQSPVAAEKVFFDSLQREILTPRERADLEREGSELLKNYLIFYRDGSSMPAELEYNFRTHGVHLDGTIPLTGKLDKLEWISEREQTVKIVDYKVTAPKSENEIRGTRESDARDITAGRYFRQLVFYALLCELSPRFPYHAEQFELDFLVPTSSGVFKKLGFVITEQDKDALKAEIRLVWQRIQNLDFQPVNLWGEESGKKAFEFLGDDF